MKTQKEIHALIVEEDENVAAAIQQILKDSNYRVTLLPRKEDAIRFLKESHVSLAVAGDAEDSDSPFQIMKEIVMSAPMTSIILVSDLPKKEVEDTAEGYGILGHTGRSVGSKDLTPLLESFERILGSF